MWVGGTTRLATGRKARACPSHARSPLPASSAFSAALSAGLRYRRIFAADLRPDLADGQLNPPADRIGGGDRQRDAQRAFGDGADDRPLDTAVAVLTID